MQRHPKTINGAVSETIEVEMYLQLSATTTRESSENKDEWISLVQTASNSQMQLSKNLAQRIEELEHLIALNLSTMQTNCNQEPTEHIKCRRCSESGHYAGGCASHRSHKTDQEQTSFHLTDKQHANAYYNYQLTVSIVIF